ncbi:DNA-binding transcriptional regulator LsrR, DeoR family [Paramicrobacterium humi]|uniref:DNA-binding transcriptional regulator LsrR, DeoR family n=1 Tax=Paramicrobacterium humi TaxID=640635 RepID=A0A1H4IWN5_9MICO|nr:sugar-binding domain-containing protein [Microbacterium humi]SEB37642.1 DNA-binding transcriptional regulator LsrR, DeoR family [Microbacterium humi]
MARTPSNPLTGKTRDALTAAQLYYLQDLTMDAIAAELHTSRSSVSRLLSHARDTGLVSIRVSSPLDAPHQIETDINRRFGVVAHVVPVPDQSSDVDRLERVALTAARILGTFVDSNMSIGVAWGATMTAVSRHLVTKHTHNSRIVQLNGAANPRTTGLVYASELLQRFGTAYGAAVQQFAVPALFDSAETKRAMWRERSVKRVLDMQREMDMTVFGLGSPFAVVPSHVYVGGYLDEDDLQAMQAAGVVGDVATVFYREDGSDDGIEINTRSSGPDLEVQRRVARRVCIVAGESKLQSLRGALAAGLVTDLIVDATTARMLLDASS